MPEPRREGKTSTGDEEFLGQDLREQTVETHEREDSNMKGQTENNKTTSTGFPGFLQGSNSRGGFTCNLIDNNIDHRNFRTKSFCEEGVSRESQNRSHGGQLICQDHQVGSRGHETPLSHDQGGMCGGTAG